MTKTFTKDFMRANKGCYDLEQLDSLPFMKVDGNEVTLESIINSDIKLKDKFWFVCKKVNTKEQNQQLAIDVAMIVLPLYEKKYPDDKRPREAIEAARDYIAGKCTIEYLREKRAAAYAAYAAAYAAYAYAAAAYAADADAAYAAYAAADDDAAAAAAYAAAADADADAAYAASSSAAAAAAYAAAAAAAASSADAAAAYAAAAGIEIKEQLFQYLLSHCEKL